MTSRARHSKRSAPVSTGLVNVGAPGQEQLDYREVSLLTGNDESRDFIVGSLVDNVSFQLTLPNNIYVGATTIPDLSIECYFAQNRIMFGIEFAYMKD